MAELPINQLPPPLQTQVHAIWHDVKQALGQDSPLLQQTEFLNSAAKVWGCSDFVAQNCVRHPAVLETLFMSGAITRQYSTTDQQMALASLLTKEQDYDTSAIVLREFRRQEMLRIAWRDLSGWASLEETITDLSNLADACIQQAYEKTYQLLSEELGIPKDNQGHQQHLVIIAVGKLGGKELNFSSDVDLIFTYPAKGVTQGKQLDNETFFLRLSQQLIKLLNDVTAQGFVFRVDMRLRPYGSSGAMAINFNAVEAYYQEQGRVWERYALVKARIINQSQLAKPLQSILQKFVFRRYVDFSVVEGLRDLKDAINRDIRQQNLYSNIKRGPGGIREIEFIVQAFQIIHGGKKPALQTNELVSALLALVKLDCLEQAIADDLLQAYEFFRNTENHLQMLDDKQTQELPSDELAQLKIAFSMGFTDWEAFLQVLDAHRDKVKAHFENMVTPATDMETLAVDPEQLSLATSTWQQLLTTAMPETCLGKLGFSDEDNVAEQLLTFKNSYRVRSMDSQGQSRLDGLMPLLLLLMGRAGDDKTMFSRIIALLDNIVKRSVYISLLNENPRALELLLNLCRGSAWLARLLAQFPFLLDGLIDQDKLYRPLTVDDLLAELRQYLVGIPVDDYEQQINALRRFKHINVLKVAASDVMDKSPLMKVSDYLTDIATVVLQQIQKIVWKNLIDKHGYPMNDDGPMVEAQFVIIGYGKLGGIELGYTSDLDLVFLYDGPQQLMTNGARPLSNSEFYLRMGQRIVHLITVASETGKLYDVDTRLRPSGKSGMLVSHIDAFANYQSEQAWTWEHQALIRARPICGSADLSERFTELRQAVLCQAREPAPLREEVLSMREKMLEAQNGQKTTEFDVKKSRGGITDIEFMVQYAVLLWAHNYPRVQKYSDNVRILEQLSEHGVLTDEVAEELIRTYKRYRGIVHEAALQEGQWLPEDGHYQALQAFVCTQWDALFEA